MNVFEDHIIEGEEGFQEAEDESYEAGYEMYHTATKTQQATFQRHVGPKDTWQVSSDLLMEVLDRTK